jgi:hypothetical protein
MLWSSLVDMSLRLFGGVLVDTSTGHSPSKSRGGPGMNKGWLGPSPTVKLGALKKVTQTIVDQDKRTKNGGRGTRAIINEGRGGEAMVVMVVVRSKQVEKDKRSQTRASYSPRKSYVGGLYCFQGLG